MLFSSPFKPPPSCSKRFKTNSYHSRSLRPLAAVCFKRNTSIFTAPRASQTDVGFPNNNRFHCKLDQPACKITRVFHNEHNLFLITWSTVKTVRKGATTSFCLFLGPFLVQLVRCRLVSIFVRQSHSRIRLDSGLLSYDT